MAAAKSQKKGSKGQGKYVAGKGRSSGPGPDASHMASRSSHIDPLKT